MYSSGQVALLSSIEVIWRLTLNVTLKSLQVQYTQNKFTYITTFAPSLQLILSLSLSVSLSMVTCVFNIFLTSFHYLLYNSHYLVPES